MKLISESMMEECVLATAAPSSFRPSEFSLPVAGALQAHGHETSRVVTLTDTTSGQLIADLIAIGRRQMLVPREHPPDPRPEYFQTFHCAGRFGLFDPCTRLAKCSHHAERILSGYTLSGHDHEPFGMMWAWRGDVFHSL